MSDPILHHYEASMFFEKVRLILGWKSVAWQSVIIEPSVPRPRLGPLTGGYRGTPTLQIGADVFCGTRVICEWLERIFPTPPLYPAGQDFTTRGVAEWADTHLFQVCVGVSFQPRALEATMARFSTEQIEAFQSDRAQSADTAAGLPQFSAGTAEAHLHHQLARLDDQLASRPFLFGAAPTVADFSVYQCLWLVAGNAVMRTMLKDYERVNAWMRSIDSLGQGERNEIEAEDALLLARDSTPQYVDEQARLLPTEFHIGDPVTITPADYGRVPVTGTLLACNEFEYVIERHDNEVDTVAIHFPRVGFAIERR